MSDDGHWLRGSEPSLTRVDLTKPLPHALLPSSVEAEHALLGALIYDNAALDRVAARVKPETFSEPFHGRLYAKIVELVSARSLAEPIILADAFKQDPAFEELGGLRYLADLVDRAPPSANVVDYADLLVETWRRREAALTGLYMAYAILKGDNAGEAIGEAERALLDVQAQTRHTRLWTAADAVDKVIGELDNPESSPAVMTGLEPLDKAVGGLMPGELILIAGRPSMGKSALASCIALNIARHGVHADGRRLGVIEVNGEMTPEQMMRRHLTDAAFTLSPREAPSYKQLRMRGPFTPAELAIIRHVAQEIRGLPTLRSIKKTGLSLSALRALVRRQQAAWEREGIALGAITVDHVGLIRSDRDWRGRTEEQTNVAIEVKELADELEIPIIGLVQVNRQCESRDDKRPTLPDLKDSGAWEENADMVIACFRAAYYANREQEPKRQDLRAEWEMRKMSKTVEAILLKVREGETGTVNLWGDMPRNAIRARAPDNMYGAPSMSFAFASVPDREVPPLAAYEGEEFAASAFE